MQLKEEQEKIIKVLKDDIIDNIFDKIKKIEDNKINLNQKIKECEDKQKEIEEIKRQIQYEDDLKKQIEDNYKTHITNKLEIEKDLKESNENIQKLNSKIRTIYDEINTIERKNIKPEEKQSAENTKKELKNKIKECENEISQIKAKIDVINKRKEKNSIIIDERKNNLSLKEALIMSKNKEAFKLKNDLEELYGKDKNKLKEERNKLEAELKKYKDNAIRHFLTIKIINEEIEKLTLNKSTINSVFELINQLSLNKKFIDNRKYFNEVIEDYKNIVQKLNESNNKNEIYKKYGLDADSIRKIEKREK